MNKVYLFVAYVAALLSIELAGTDAPLEFDGGLYKIANEDRQYGTLQFSVTSKEPIAEYRLLAERKNGIFSCGMNQIEYQLIDTDRSIFHIDGNEGFKKLSLRLFLPEGRVLAPGTYTSQIPIKIMKNQEIVLEEEITAFFPVEEQLEAGVFIDGELLSDEGVKVFFGTIDGKDEKMITLSIKANRSVTVSAVSKNHGRLVLEGEEDDLHPSFIPYLVQSKGAFHSLTSEVELFKEPFSPNKKETLSTIKFLVHPDAHKTFHGKYRDQVYITISSL